MGSSTTRLSGLVSHGQAFESLFVQAPLLAASSLLIGTPFKLSSMLGRTLRPHTAAQDLHTDPLPSGSELPMVGFIVMIDDFCKDNGATRFLPGSHRKVGPSRKIIPDLRAPLEGQVLACGEAGSVVVFNASIWHGHTENSSDTNRRSIQGYYISRSCLAADDYSALFTQETLDRLDPLAKYLLAV